MSSPIILEVRGGIVYEVSNPDQIEIRIKDYDVDGMDELEFDENGDPCWEYIP